MASLSARFKQFWRSGEYVGAATPTQKVSIRRGQFTHFYAPWKGSAELNVTILDAAPNGHSGQWQGAWQPIDDWREIPAVDEVDLSQDFTKNGITDATIVVTNVDMQENTGSVGIFHRILRGFLSPWYGAASKLSPRPKTGMVANDWIGYLNQPAQIKVEQGYGSETAKTFTGLIDNLDLKSLPDEVTITARDFGEVLEQPLLGHVKDPRLLDSNVVFVDRRSWQKATEVGSAGPNDCSSADPAHPARYATDSSLATAWASQSSSGPDGVEWLQVNIPAGQYNDFTLDPAYAGMECYVSVYASARRVSSISKRPQVDGTEIPEGWVDLGLGRTPVDPDAKQGDVGLPYVKHFGSLAAAKRDLSLGHAFEVGDGSLLRLTFTRLRKVSKGGVRRYRAGVRTLRATRLTMKPGMKVANPSDLILVDDVADMVKVALVWAGFQEWNVESTGARIPSDTNFTFTNGNNLLDIIKKAQEVTNYVFFMDDPTAADLSIGVPTFRSPRITPPAFEESLEVTETSLLAGAEVKWDRSTLPEYVIARGASTNSRKGRMLDTEQMLRWQGRYTPIWTRNGKTAGLRRYVVHTYDYLTDQQQVDVAARMIALNGALQSLTAIIQIPGYPGVSLDEVIGVIDSGSGLNSRMYVATKTSQFIGGVQKRWLTTLGGALLDEPYIQTTLDDYRRATEPGELNDAVPSRDPNVPIAISGYPQARSRPGRVRARKYR